MRVLKGHSPAFGMTEIFADALVAARSAAPFVGPDQPTFEAMLSSLAAAWHPVWSIWVRR